MSESAFILSTLLMCYDDKWLKWLGGVGFNIGLSLEKDHSQFTVEASPG